MVLFSSVASVWSLHLLYNHYICWCASPLITKHWLIRGTSVSVYIDHVTYFNRTTTVTNPIRAYSTIRIPCPGTRLFITCQPTISLFSLFLKYLNITLAFYINRNLRIILRISLIIKLFFFKRIFKIFFLIYFNIKFNLLSVDRPEQSGPGARNTYSTICSLRLLTVVVLLK